MKLELKYDVNDIVYVVWNGIVHECIITQIEYTENYKIHYRIKAKDNKYVGNFCEEDEMFSNKNEAENKAKSIIKEKLTKEIDDYIRKILSLYKSMYNFEVKNLKFENDKVIIEEEIKYVTQ